MKYLSSLLAISLLLAGCEKEQNKNLLGAYFNYKVNGVDVSIKDGSGVNNNVFTCQMWGDTVISIEAQEKYARAGFYIRATKITDGTYAFDSTNSRAFYSDPLTNRTYYTNKTYTGQVTIKRGTFQAKSLLNTLQGTFSFKVYDDISFKLYDITDGTFLMEITEK